MGFKSFCLVLALVLSATMLGGCSDGLNTGCTLPPPPPPSSYDLPFPSSETQLMHNFRTVYEEMRFDGYRDMIHADYETFLQNSTQVAFPFAGPTLDQAEELRIAERLFSGQPVTDRDGALVHAVSSISFDVFEQQGEWQNAPANDPIPNGRFAMFDVTFLTDRPGASTIKTSGQIKFYVTGRDSVIDGVMRTYWQMIGQQDLTESATKGIEVTNWGSLKVLFY